MVGHSDTGLHDAVDHLSGGVGMPVAAQTRNRNRVVVWPDRAVVIAHRVVMRRVGGQGADPPTGEHVRRHQTVAQQLGPLGIDDAGPQAVRGVGRDGGDRRLVPVESLGVELLGIEPELQLEAPAKLGGFARQPFGQRGLAEPLQDATQPDLRLIDVTLDFDQRRR